MHANEMLNVSKQDSAGNSKKIKMQKIWPDTPTVCEGDRPVRLVLVCFSATATASISLSCVASDNGIKVNFPIAGCHQSEIISTE